MKSLSYIQYLFDPYNVIACYAIFLVVPLVKSNDTRENIILISELKSENIDCEFPVGALSSSIENLTDFEITEGDIVESLHKDINRTYENGGQEKIPVVGNVWWHDVFTPEPIPQSECEKEIQQYLRGLQHFELWAMQMWDATAKPAAGLLSGNANQLGDYDSCLEVHLAALGKVHGKYCLADIDLEASSDALPSVRAAITKLQAGRLSSSKHTDPSHFAPRWTTLHWGLCVPASCSDREVEAGLHHYLQAYQLHGVTLDIAVKPEMCHTSQSDSALPLLTLVTLGFFGGILMLAVVATMVDNNINFPFGNKLKARDRALLAFSLRRNWQLLVAHEPDELPVIHGIRSLFTIMLLVAHKMIPVGLTPYSNRSMITQASHSWLSAIPRASSVFTDSFLQLSAVLAAYNISKELQKRGSISWQKRIIGRFLRLTPALIAVVLFYAYIMEHLGSGPQWYSIITVNADICKANLWKNIFYIQNFFPFENMCAPHTHQLALDMQLFLTAPLVVYCLHHWPRFSVGALVLCQLAIASLRYFTYLNNNLSLFVYHSVSLTDMYRTANMSYTKAVQRAIPYIIGLITGFFLQRVRTFHLSHTQVAAGWVMCVGLAAVSLFYQAHLVLPSAVLDAYDSAFYSAFFPITWSAALSWLIFACSSGYGGWFNKALCHHWFVILSRLSYSVYLVQFIIFFYYVGNVRASQEFSMFYIFGGYEIGGIALASLFVTLLFDLPMQEIKCILLPTRKADKVS